MIRPPDTDLDLGVVGNCTFCALIDRRASVAWACLPRFDGDPVFSGLLEGSRPEDERSRFDVEVEGFDASEQRYLENTPVLVTTIRDHEGRALEVTDFAPRFSRYGRRFRPMTLVRILRPVEGQPRIRIRVRPRFGDARRPPEVTHGSNHIRYVGPDLALRLTTDAPLAYLLAGGSWFYLEEPITLILGPDESLTQRVTETGEEFLHSTTAYWREWVRHLHVPLEWQEAVIRAAITLKLCWFEETGAIIAAMTTSVPEAAHTGRNWDYRYCWVRDAYYVIRALNELGAVDILESYLRYVRNLVGAARNGHIQPVSGIDLRQFLPERIADALPGYRNMGPVRFGNDAYRHVQHDVYGQVVLSNAQAFFDRRLLRPVGERDFAQLERVGERAFRVHREPDAGLWELRTTARVHTYSSLMCWAACDRLASIAEHLGRPERAAFWRERAGVIREFIEERAWNPRLGCYTGAIDGDALDASLLLLADLGFHDAAHPRFTGTVQAIEASLYRDGNVFRYVMEDDFGRPQNAFNICTFWYIDALAAMGDEARERARALFERMLERCNHVGLLSEDIDPATGELWGNYPQTYSLVGIINGAVRLSRPWTFAR